MRRSINRVAVQELFDRGRSVSEIAQEMNCGKGAISKILKNMGLSIVKSAAAEAPGFVRKKITASDTLALLVEKAQKELEWIEQEVPPTKTEEYMAWQDQKIKFTAEMRKLIASIADLGYKLFQAKEVSETLEIILEEIRHETPECARRIQERLERRRHIRVPF